MAYIYGLIRLCKSAFIFLTFFSIPALSQTCNPSWQAPSGGNGQQFIASTPEAAFQMNITAAQQAVGNGGTYTAGSCDVWTTSTPSVICHFTYTRITQGTTAPGTRTITNLSPCAQSPSPTCPTAGTTYGEGQIQIAPGSSPESATGFDHNGCGSTVSCSTIVEYDSKRYCYGKITYNGLTGTGTPVGNSTPEQTDKLKDGYCPGEVNGTTVYVPCTSVSQQTDSSTTTNSNGSTTSTKTNTQCNGTTCTTTETTTTTDSSGTSSTSTKSTTEPQSDFCKSNTSHPSCKVGSFSGSCEGGFKCDGDAIQCAMAKVQHENKCALTPSPNAGAAYFDALTEGMPNNPNSGTVTVSSSMFNSSNLLGASSCTLDKSITVLGSTINLPFSQVCTALAYMGTLLQAVGFLLGARIITRG